MTVCDSRLVRPKPPSPSASGGRLRFNIATTLDEVIEAWQLVYESYVRSDLVDPNPEAIHTVPEAVSPRTAVVIGRINGTAVNTLTAVLDGPKGLALDQVYGYELDLLRRQGRRLMELGLFADRRESLVRSFRGVLDLMRYATYYGLHHGVTDAVIGVHPRHVSFYQRYLHFDRVGAVRQYSVVRDHPVVLLRLNWPEKTQLNPLPAGMEFILDNPIPAEAFEVRYNFDPDDMAISIIATYLRLRHQYPEMMARSA